MIQQHTSAVNRKFEPSGRAVRGWCGANFLFLLGGGFAVWGFFCHI